MIGSGRAKKDKPCQMCGEMLFNVSPHKMYCKRCLREREKQRRKWGYTPPPKPTPPAMSVAEIAVAARAAGVSYGQYVSMMQRGGKP